MSQIILDVRKYSNIPKGNIQVLKSKLLTRYCISLKALLKCFELSQLTMRENTRTRSCTYCGKVIIMSYPVYKILCFPALLIWRVYIFGTISRNNVASVAVQSKAQKTLPKRFKQKFGVPRPLEFRYSSRGRLVYTNCDVQIVMCLFHFTFFSFKLT